MSLTNSSFYILSDGTVKVCGYNGTYELGLGDTTTRNTPILISGLTNVNIIMDRIIIKILLYLLNQDGLFYSINSNRYSNDLKSYISLDNSSAIQDLLNNYGFLSISDLLNNTTIGTETFKPISKFSNKFKIIKKCKLDVM